MHGSRSRRLTRAAVLLTALVGVAATATGEGPERASRTPALTETQRAYSIANVKKAFAAEGMPLTLESRYGGVTELSPEAGALLGDLTVTVWPPSKATGTLLVVVESGHRTVRVGNVDVDYAQTSPRSTRVLSAIARLRRMTRR